MSQTITATSGPARTSAAPGVFELHTLGGAGNSRKGRKVDSASFQEEGLISPGSQNGGDSVPPPDAQNVVERWNYPRGNIKKMAFAFLSFFVVGMNDAAIGPLLPYLEDYYGLGKTVISLIFLTPVIGYSLAAISIARIHVKFGQRGIAIMAPLCHIVTYAVLSSHPPYPALIVVNAIRVLACVLFSRSAILAAHRYEYGCESRSSMVQFLLHHVGLGGWVVTFMLNVRHASAYASGISGTGFWAGMALGRATLGFVTERFGERLCLAIYLAICLGLELLFWLVPDFIVSAVAVAFLGFFLGPMFPGAVMITAKLLPKRIHVSAIGFAMSMGATGSAVLPFIIGVVASKKGVTVLQPIILALIAVIALVWLSFPRARKRD
ncbi:hypothetical protein LMH87_005740 [Akanthomyces muscarius]|uniref:Major facilitator superfamily (MFS) profile domain-containing protein n=1 Tax=Akanthomyces muscarius TaxID=2231603 RepID=A0A9W8US60_AKAMU|nr:hypothetical protein LMH87_005740 [Akanthomyces muscarius]KAJ4164050.1 hypothetical protein LMH87_005740 [Akanthomyces muscarius]